MNSFNFTGKNADKVNRMSTSKPSTNLLFLALFALPSLASASNQPLACDSRDLTQGRLQAAETALNDANTEKTRIDSDPTKTAADRNRAATRLLTATQARDRLQTQFAADELRCSRALDTAVIDQRKCEERNGRTDEIIRDKKTGTNSKMWVWRDGKCEATFAEGDRSLSEGECNQAAQFEGQLRGQNCKAARDTVKDVTDRNKAITDSTVAIGTTYAQVQAMAASGQQQNAQEQQKKVLQGLAISKLVSGGSALAGAAQLKAAGSEASSAETAMSGAYKGIEADCNNLAPFNGNRQACFYQMAPRHGVNASRAEYQNFDRLTGGASQSADAAKAANSAALASGITGLADTVVGIQALQMANQAQQQQKNMGAIAPPRVIGIAPFSGASQAPNTGGLPVGAVPTDYGIPGADGATLGNMGPGNIRGGMKGNPRGFGVSPFQSAKSGVSAAGGGGGGGGGRGGGGGKGGSGRSKGLGNTAVGEYNMAGGAPSYKGGGKDEGPGGNAFADALAKLFPTGADGKPIVDGRGLASGEDPNGQGGEEEEGGNVYASELSLFEQVNAKYRQLSGAGTI